MLAVRDEKDGGPFLSPLAPLGGAGAAGGAPGRGHEARDDSMRAETGRWSSLGAPDRPGGGGGGPPGSWKGSPASRAAPRYLLFPKKSVKVFLVLSLLI